MISDSERNMSPLEKIEYWKSVFLEGEKSPREFVAMIADDVDYVSEHRGYVNFKPRDINFISGHLSSDEASAQFYILKVKPEAKIKLSELERIWGKAQEGLMYPEDRDTVVVFEDVPVKPDDKYKARIRAYIDGEIESKESNLLEFKVRREELIITEADEN